MLNFLKIIRYLVFFVFIISNAIVTSVAVWNLTLVEGSMRYSPSATAAASYLIAVATLGLLLIFPIIFLEITGKWTFIGTVRFELPWTGLFGVLTLVGASLITSLSSKELCPKVTNPTTPFLASPCSSAQVLSVFTWMPAIFLLAYVTLLSILAFVRSRDDPAIWKTPVWDVPVDKILGGSRRNSVAASLPRILKSPVIHAPKPRYIIPPLIDCRSSRNSAYDSQPPPLPPKSEPVQERSWYQPPGERGTYTSTAFYNPSVQKVIPSGDRSRMPPLPAPVLPVSNGRRGQVSPPPLGDWPRLDATSRPRTKRYPHPDSSQAQGTSRVRESPAASRPSSLRRTAPPSATSLPIVERPTVPLKPPGRGRSGSTAAHRPPPLDLSRISAHRTRSQRSRARAGR